MEKYVNLKKIASGSYGDIFKTKIENKDVVVKKIFFDNDKELEICMLVNNLKISYFVKFIEKINKSIPKLTIDIYLEIKISIFCRLVGEGSVFNEYIVFDAILLL